MGIEPASVERPGSVTDLAVALLNRSENLSQFPGDLSMEVAPYWIFAGRNIRYEEYANPKSMLSSILQTLSVSLASSSRTDTDSLAKFLALGIRFSPMSGNIDPTFDNYATRLDSLYVRLGEINSELALRGMERKTTDSALQTLKRQLATADEALIPVIETQLARRNTQIENDVKEEVWEEFNQPIEAAQELASSLRFRRLGWKWDIAGGFMSRFPFDNFDNSQLDKWGIWTTAGREWTRHGLLGVARYIGHRANSDSSSIDLGARAIYDNAKKLSFSIEAIYRKFPGLDNENTRWRAALLLDYAIAKNKAITFTFGRDFGGRRSGNLISLIGLVFGFGSDRPI
jgi:hypothetical protein